MSVTQREELALHSASQQASCLRDLKLPGARPTVSGKFIFVGDEKFYVKGVTYGAFRPDDNGNEYHDLAQIERDFAQMAACGINTVRIPHTMPPRSLLDIAARHGLRVMVGLSAEQYVGYLADGKRGPNVAAIIKDKVRTVAGHPALLSYAIGNEIPASIVRWLGRRRVERYLHRIYRVIKGEDPEGIVTYVNYPSTEYLQLPFLDAVCFNVYLESQRALKLYLARLQNIADERPLIMSELGLDALRNGQDVQARTLEWQIRITFAAGCAGAIVFSWTDEWFRAGAQVEDWAFGLTDQERRSKPALAVVLNAFAEVPFPPSLIKPLFSVIVCSHNGAPRIRECLEGLRGLEYPNYEVIVVNDGSKDATAFIAAEHDVRLINTDNHGLSHARNIGLKAAKGEFVAYIDDDAYPDPQWIDYLVASFLSTNHVGIGGPNIDPAGDGLVADCVANSPGGPIHVLLTDEIAEHIPGCNMAFRKSALEAIGGFDPQFRTAGDDVDVCWRLQQRGWTLGFSPGAVVWHHCRNTLRAYWRQQKGYGKAEALLEAKWPEKYNSAGHHTFKGRIYGRGIAHVLAPISRIYHGVWGSAPFQLLYQARPGTLWSLPMMPEWFLLVGLLAFFCVLGLFWSPLLLMVPAFAFTMALTLLQASLSSSHAIFKTPHPSWSTRLALRSLTAFLHLAQPLARLCGRLRHGLVFWRHRGAPRFALPLRREFAIWTEDWIAPEQRLQTIEQSLRSDRCVVLVGDEFGRWDLEVRGGMFGAARLLMAVEDHGAGTQYVRICIWPRCRKATLILFGALGVVSATAAMASAWHSYAALAFAFTLLAAWTIRQSGSAVAALLRAVKLGDAKEKP